MTNVIEFLKNNNLMDDPIETKVLMPSPYNQNEIHFIVDGDKRYVFKIYRDGHIKEYQNELDCISMFNKINALSTISPKIYMAGTIRVDGEDKDYIIEEYFNGTSMDIFIEQLDDSELKHIADDVMKIFETEENLISVPYYSDDSETMIEKAMNKALNKLKIDWIRRLDFSSDAINKCIELSKEANNPKALHLITQDLRARHLLYNNTGFIGIIDLEYVKLNDIALEIGHFLHDLLLLNTSNSKRLFYILRDKLNEKYSREDINRIYLYMIKQGITNVASKMDRGLDMDIVLAEIKTIKKYIVSRNIDDIL